MIGHKPTLDLSIAIPAAAIPAAAVFGMCNANSEGTS
jgi:hypothetical protein